MTRLLLFAIVALFGQSPVAAQIQLSPGGTVSVGAAGSGTTQVGPEGPKADRAVPSQDGVPGPIDSDPVETAALPAVIDPADGADTESADWLQPRVELAARMCAATAPSFSDFSARADGFGFARQPDGVLRRDPDLVANLLPAPNGCVCGIAFRADNGQAAADALASQLVRFRDIRVAAHEDPQVWARILHRDAETLIRINGAEQSGTKWVQIGFFGPRACPANEGANQ